MISAILPGLLLGGSPGCSVAALHAGGDVDAQAIAGVLLLVMTIIGARRRQAIRRASEIRIR